MDATLSDLKHARRFWSAHARWHTMSYNTLVHLCNTLSDYRLSRRGIWGSVSKMVSFTLSKFKACTCSTLNAVVMANSGAWLLVNFDLNSQQNMLETLNLHHNVTMVYNHKTEFLFEPRASSPGRRRGVLVFNAFSWLLVIFDLNSQRNTLKTSNLHHNVTIMAYNHKTEFLFEPRTASPNGFQCIFYGSLIASKFDHNLQC